MAIEFDIQESKILKGVYIITPNKFKDLRGELWTVYDNEKINELLPSGLKFCLDKISISHHNVLRGIHSDHKSYKLMTVLSGQIQLAIVDLRKDSLSYLKYESFIIDKESTRIILIPPFVGNAHYVSSKESAVFYYKWAFEGEYVDAAEQITVRYDDKKIGIDWGDINPILSKRDLSAKYL